MDETDCPAPSPYGSTVANVSRRDAPEPHPPDDTAYLAGSLRQGRATLSAPPLRCGLCEGPGTRLPTVTRPGPQQMSGVQEEKEWVKLPGTHAVAQRTV